MLPQTIGTNASVSAFTTAIQHSTGDSGQCFKAKKWENTWGNMSSKKTYKTQPL